jgi:hypothetical protein
MGPKEKYKKREMIGKSVIGLKHIPTSWNNAK